MTSIKVKFRPSLVNGQNGTLYYQIIHCRKVRTIITGFHISPKEWDEKHDQIRLGRDCDRNPTLNMIRERIKLDVERISRIDKRLDNTAVPYTVDEITEDYAKYMERYSLVSFMQAVIDGLDKSGKTGTVIAYRSALKSFENFLSYKKYDYGINGIKDNDCSAISGNDIMLDCITSETMESYESWLKKRNATQNTTSFYTRILRAVYNRAVEEGAIENRRPFRRVYTGVDKTVKRALPLSALRKIKEMDLNSTPALDYARDIFLLSFFLRGMSFIDMVHLKTSDLRNGYVIYRRRKSRQPLRIKWTSQMQTILDKYPEYESGYLLPIIRKSVTADDDAELRRIYRNTGRNITRNLNKIGEMIGLSVPLTLYVARHSWASVARAKGVPINVISEGMGHDSETTTQIYLASLDTSAVDRANSKILSAI